MVPSSSIRLVAGTCTAARPERLLTRSRAFGSSSQSSASASEVGVLRRFSAMVRSWVSAPGAGMGVDHPGIGDAEALGAQRLEPEVIDPGGDGALDPLIEQFLEGREEYGLHVDRQREQAIEEGRDRGQVVLQTVVIGQAEAGGILEGPERAARHIAAIDAAVKLTQSVAGIGATRGCPRGGTAPARRSGAGRA